ncbi:hypothetical protein ACIOHS_47820 [Streptomyces sp. NPDC088253]|uniref:hypothetical protein n=1 Tax=Streptomyces sp. NPDC088253 TaxID=3365846 RepID=UPI0037F478D6
MVPLAEAWRSGADTWTADQRRDFGNDLKDPQLLIASESSNSSKSDSGPAEWKPTNKTFWCTNGKDYTHVKSGWKLTPPTRRRRPCRRCSTPALFDAASCPAAEFCLVAVGRLPDDAVWWRVGLG